MILNIFLILIILVVCDKSSEDYGLLGDKYFKENNYKECINQYTKAWEVGDSNSNRYLYKRAEAHFLEKKFELSLRDLKKLYDMNSRDGKVLSLLGKVNLIIGELEQSKSFYDLALKENPENKNYLKNVKKVNEAIQLVQNITSDNCIKIYRKLLRDFCKESRKFTLKRAECSIENKRFKSARADLQKLLRKSKNDVDSLHLYSLSLFMMGFVDDSKSNLKKCLSLDPDHDKCRGLFKKIRAGQKELKQAEEKKQSGKMYIAIKHYKDYLSLYDGDVYNSREILREICKSYCDMSKWNLCIENCKKCEEDDVECMFPTINAFLDEDGKEGIEKAKEVLRNIKGMINEENYRQQINNAEQQIQKAEKILSRKNYYKILNVTKHATTKEIKKSYKKLSLIWHPDRCPSEEMAEECHKKFIELNEAIEILTDEEKRRRYDSGEDIDSINGRGGNPFEGQFRNFGFFQQGGGGGFNFRFG